MVKMNNGTMNNGTMNNGTMNNGTMKVVNMKFPMMISQTIIILSFLFFLKDRN